MRKAMKRIQGKNREGPHLFFCVVMPVNFVPIKGIYMTATHNNHNNRVKNVLYYFCHQDKQDAR